MRLKGSIIGTGKMVAKLVGAGPKVRAQAEVGVTKACLWLKGESMGIVPVATGNLRASAFITTLSLSEHPKAGNQIDKNATTEAYALLRDGTKNLIIGVIAYAAVYALSVHENPWAGLQGHLNSTTRTGKPKGRIKWANTGRYKYLEEPLKRGEGTILRILTREAGKVKL